MALWTRRRCSTNQRQAIATPAAIVRLNSSSLCGGKPVMNRRALRSWNTASEPTPAPIASASEPLPAALHTKIDAKCGNDPGVGTAAKPFTLKTPDGKDISLASYRGKVVLLNFWGTWCKPCLKELPEFDRLYRRYRKHGLAGLADAAGHDADIDRQDIRTQLEQRS